MTGGSYSETVRSRMEELGVSDLEPLFRFRSYASEEEFSKMMLDVRKRSRNIESISWTVIIAVCIVLSFKTGSFYFSGFAAVGVYRIYSNMVKAKRFIEANFEERRKRRGSGEVDEYLWFFDEAYISDHGERGCYIHSYGKEDFIYLKNGYMFIGSYANKGANMTGDYIIYRDCPDKEAFIAFIREKNPNARVMK